MGDLHPEASGVHLLVHVDVIGRDDRLGIDPRRSQGGDDVLLALRFAPRPERVVDAVSGFGPPGNALESRVERPVGRPEQLAERALKLDAAYPPARLLRARLDRLSGRLVEAETRLRALLKGAAAVGVAGALPQTRFAQAQTTQKKELVTAQGGDVVAGENPGGGAVLTVYLPYKAHGEVPVE